MKICIINHSDSRGGAARAAARIHTALLAENQDSTFLTAEIKGNIPKTYNIYEYFNLKDRSKLAARASNWINRFNKDRSYPWSLPMANTHLADSINSSDFDIVNLHWVNNGLFSLRDISRIRKPVFWTLHDQWPILGIEHFEKHADISRSRIFFIIDSQYAAAKRRIFKNSITFICPSNWMKKSALKKGLDEHRVYHIPNAIDVEAWRKAASVADNAVNFCLPTEKKLIAFGSWGGGTDKRKGSDLMLQVVRALKDSKLDLSRLCLVVLGDKPPEFADIGRPECIPVGHINDDRQMAWLYDRCDLVALPSRSDNLPNMAVESIVCGTPVVCFDTGGNRDIVVHRKNGFVAAKDNVPDFVEGIEWCLNADRAKIKSYCFDIALQRFSQKEVARQYLSLFSKTSN